MSADSNNQLPSLDNGQVPNQENNNPAPGGQTPPSSNPQAGNDQQALTLEQALDALKKARQEAASHRTKLSAFEKQEEERKAAAMSDLEKATKRAQELEALSQQQAQQLQEMRVMQSVMQAATKHSLVDAEAAAKLIDWASIEYDDQGNPTNIDKLISELAKAKPYLVAQQNQQQAPRTPPMNPGRAQRQAPQTPAQPFDYANRPTLGAIWKKDNS